MQLEENNTLIRHTYKQGAANNNLLTNEIIEEYLLIHLKKVEKYQPSKMVMDIRMFSISMDNKLFCWIIENINPKSNCIKKLALVADYKLIIESYIHKIKATEMICYLPEIKYFKTTKEANEWVKL